MTHAATASYANERPAPAGDQAQPWQVMPANWDTLVYVPSIALGPLTRRHLVGLDYFQERNYYLAAGVSEPDTRIIFVLSRAMQDELLNAHLDLLRRTLALSQAALARIHVLKVEQPPDRSLSAALLADKASLERLRTLLGGRRAGFDFWTVGEDEIALAGAFNLPYIGMPPYRAGADSKAAAKRMFRQAGVQTPPDFGVFHDLSSLWQACADGKFSAARTVLLKLNSEEGGNGIARLPLGADLSSVQAMRSAITIDKPYIQLAQFEEQMALQGALVETFLDDNVVASPSVKMLIDEDGEVSCLATHDQILSNSMYLGCRFPADEAYRSLVSSAGCRIGSQCAQDGWRGIVSVDFLLTGSRANSSGPIEQNLWAIEINARKGATTHPYFWTRTLTGATYDADRGILQANGRETVYRSAEYVATPGLAQLSGSQILDLIRRADLEYDPATRKGVLVHMLSCAQLHRKIGVTAIANTHDEADTYIRRVELALSRHSPDWNPDRPVP